MFSLRADAKATSMRSTRARDRYYGRRISARRSSAVRSATRWTASSTSRRSPDSRCACSDCANSPFPGIGQPAPENGGRPMPTARLVVRFFDGRRRLFEDGSFMVRILDGNKEQQFFGRVNAPEHAFDVPCWDNSRDFYTVLASRDGYVGNGYYPIKVATSHPEVIDLMLLPVKHRFDFSTAKWELLLASHGQYCDLLSALAADAPTRWDALLPD